MPAAWRCASVSRECEVLAGWVMVVLVSPRLAVIEHTRVLSITWNALRRARSGPPSCSPLTMNDTTAPPQPACCAHRQRVLRVRCPARGGTRARSAAALRSHCASCSALAACARMRIDSVSRPLSTTQALKGDRRHARAAHHRHELLVDEPRARADGARDHAALAVEVLGAGVDDEVGAELGRPLQRRRAEAVVHRQQRARVVRDRGQRRDVAHLGQRIARRLGEEQLRVRADRARHSSTSVCETNVVSMPNFANSRLNSTIVEPNTLCEQTT